MLVNSIGYGLYNAEVNRHMFSLLSMPHSEHTPVCTVLNLFIAPEIQLLQVSFVYCLLTKTVLTFEIMHAYFQ